MNSQCVLKSTITIVTQASIEVVADVKVSAKINPAEEAAFGTPTFMWQVATTLTDSTKQTMLRTYLSSLSSKDIVIPVEFILLATEYVISASYFNNDGNFITKSATLIPICPEQFFYSPGSGCQPCSKACLICKDSSTCLKCMDIAILNNSVCLMDSYLILTAPV